MISGQKFKTLFNYLKSLQSRYFKTLSAFYIYEGILESTAPNIVGQEQAEKNLKTRNRFNYFFLMSREALRIYFLLELAKLFDESNQSLHINKIINFAGSNINKLSKSHFLQFHQSRTFLSELIKQYKAIDSGDLTKIKNDLKKHAGVIKKLSDYRDQYLAHDDRKKEKINISSGEITTLLKVLKEILNLFSSRLDFSTTTYSHVERDCKGDTRRVIEYLGRFELYRLKEVSERYK